MIPHPDNCASGALCLVVGPSGVGKDSLLAGVQERLSDRFVFPTRLITRPADAGGEDHEAVDVQQLSDLEAAGELGLSWRAHGLAYGIRSSALRDLDAGRSVVVNVSRSILDDVRAAFSRVHVFSITAPEAVLRERLCGRGREDAHAIEERIARALAFRVEGPDVTKIANDADLSTGIERLATALEAVSRGAR